MKQVRCWLLSAISTLTLASCGSDSPNLSIDEGTIYLSCEGERRSDTPAQAGSLSDADGDGYATHFQDSTNYYRVNIKANEFAEWSDGAERFFDFTDGEITLNDVFLSVHEEGESEGFAIKRDITFNRTDGTVLDYHFYTDMASSKLDTAISFSGSCQTSRQFSPPAPERVDQEF